MKALIVFLFTILCAISTEWETSTFRVTQEGNSANWVIQNLWDDSQVRIRIDALEETSNRKFDWQTSKEVKITTGQVNFTKDGVNVPVDYINYNCDLCSVKDAKETFNFKGSIDVFLFNEGGNYTIRGQEVQIQPGAFKFNFEFSKWTFSSDTTKLTQNVFVKEENQKKSMQYARFLTKKESYGSFQIEYPEYAVVDDKLTTITISTTGKSSNQQFEFPQFQNYVYYDPTVFTSNTDPIPPEYVERETNSMRVFYNPHSPDFYLLDLDKQVKSFLHVQVTDTNESSGGQYADFRKQTYELKEGSESIICDGGKINQIVNTIKYTCKTCITSLNQAFDGLIQVYLINETLKSCNFGQKIGYKVDVQSGDTKMDVRLTKWPWKDQKSKLKLTIVTEEGKSDKLFELGTSRKVNDMSEFSASFAQESVVFSLADPQNNKAEEAKIEVIDSQNIVELSNFDGEHGVYYDPLFHKGSNASLLSLILMAFIFLL